MISSVTVEFVQTLIVQPSSAVIVAKNKTLRGEFFERGYGEKLSFKKVFPA